MKRILLATALLIPTLGISGSLSFSDSAVVTSVKPNYATYTKQIPVRKCSDVEVYHKGSSGQAMGGALGSNPLGSIIGGALGGVLGHQVGRGAGKTAATIGGAIIGSQLGNSHIGNSQGNYQATDGYTTLENRCKTVYETSREERISGYTVSADYNGHPMRFKTKKNYYQGDTIQLWINVTPRL